MDHSIQWINRSIGLQMSHINACSPVSMRLRHLRSCGGGGHGPPPLWPKDEASGRQAQLQPGLRRGGRRCRSPRCRRIVVVVVAPAAAARGMMGLIVCVCTCLLSCGWDGLMCVSEERGKQPRKPRRRRDASRGGRIVERGLPWKWCSSPQREDHKQPAGSRQAVCVHEIWPGFGEGWLSPEEVMNESEEF